MKRIILITALVLFITSLVNAQFYIDVDTAVELFVNKHPIQDSTGTIDETIAFNETNMNLIWHFIPCAGTPTSTEVTPTSGGIHDWAHTDGGIYKIEIPASGGTINNDTEGSGKFTGSCDGVLPWSSDVYIFRHANKNDLEIEDGTAQTNQDAFFDGTGYVGGTAKMQGDVVKWNGSTDGIANWATFFGNATTFGKFADNYDGTKVSLADLFNDNMTQPDIEAYCQTGAAAAIAAVTMQDLTAVPAITASLADAINWMFAMARNRMVTTPSGTNIGEIAIYKDDKVTKIAERDYEDTGTYYEEDEWRAPD